jgi:two-component system response regulator AtoC
MASNTEQPYMANRGQTILVGEDELEVRGYFQMALRCLGYSVELAQDGNEVLACLRSSRGEIGAVLLDIVMPNRDGLDTLREIRSFNPELPVIMVSGVASSMNIVSAMKTGATDFLCKPVAHDDLRKAITRAFERNGDPTPPSRIPAPSTGMFIGSNPKLRQIQSLIGQIGWSEAPVLIQGETGSGKEVVARELHSQSPRASKPFLKLNCAALPSELVESELFGYERGAFTGAFQRKAGMFETADGGTLLLDEIGDMDVRLQSKLLQVLQDSSFQRIGGKEMVKVDVRVMAATHRDLEQAIKDRTFREDLYYRLNVINVHLPPLRECREDVLPMAEFLMKRHASKNNGLVPSFTDELTDAVMAYPWPGNVRELENFARKFLIFRDPEAVAAELREKNARLAPPAASTPPPDSAPRTSSPILERVGKAKQQAETDAILSALNSTHWNRKRAAVLLQIDYKALLYKMKKLGIEGKAVPILATITLGFLGDLGMSGATSLLY